jgi:hypothetical protein
MNFTRISGDIAKLPAELLPLAKQQERIEFCDDDQLIVELCARVIEQFEIYSQGMQINPAQWRWKFAGSDFCEGRIRCRFWPITNLVIVDAGDVDVTANYEIMSESIAGMPVNWLEGPAVDCVATVDVGWPAANQIPPAIRAELMRQVGHAYEYRELLTPSNLAIDPSWQQGLAYWMPRL